ncbi:MAG: periplasmic heavy metal sensor [Sphingomonadaceae bacterium]
MKTLTPLMIAGALAAPALAQNPPPPPAGAQAAPEPGPTRVYRMERRMGFGNVSPEGRKVLVEAMRMSKEDRAAIIAQRDRINELLAADRLDVAALRRAMEAERRLVDHHHARRQAAMLDAFQKLSAEDRKAFAADARRGRAMAEGRTEEWRRWAEEIRRRMRDLPPPPPAAPAAPSTGIDLD